MLPSEFAETTQQLIYAEEKIKRLENNIHKLSLEKSELIQLNAEIETSVISWKSAYAFQIDRNANLVKKLTNSRGTTF